MQEAHWKWIEGEISLYHAVRYNVDFVTIHPLHVLQMYKHVSFNVTFDKHVLCFDYQNIVMHLFIDSLE